MTKLFAAKNCNRLLLKCILYPSLLNAAFFLTAHFLDLSFIQCQYFGCLQFLCGILLAVAMRKGSRETVLREPQKRGRYAAITFISGIAIIIHISFFSGNLFILYSYFLMFIYHKIGYARMSSLTDFLNVFLCLACVFFYKFKWLTAIQNFILEKTAAHSCKQLLKVCVVSAIVLNVPFYIFAFANLLPVEFLIFGGLQLFCSLLLGLFLRRQNRSVLSRESQTRSRVWAAAFVGCVGLLALALYPPHIVMTAYEQMTMAFQFATGLPKVFHVFDLFSILVCMGAVFFHMRKNHCPALQSK